MSEDLRILQNNKADSTRIVAQKPSNSEGFNGDIAVGNTANGSSLFAKISNAWYEFSSNESLEAFSQPISGSASYFPGGFHDTGTSNFLPLGRNLDEQGTFAGSGAENAEATLLLVYDARPISLTVRSTNNLGDSYIKIYSASNGLNINSSNTATLIETSSTINCASAHTAYTFSLSGNYILSAGNILAIQLVTTNNHNTICYSFTLDYDVVV